MKKTPPSFQEPHHTMAQRPPLHVPETFWTCGSCKIARDASSYHGPAELIPDFAIHLRQPYDACITTR